MLDALLEGWLPDLDPMRQDFVLRDVDMLESQVCFNCTSLSLDFESEGARLLT